MDPDSWWLFTLPSLHLLTSQTSTIWLFGFVLLIVGLLSWASSAGGTAWNQLGRVPIPGPRGLPIFGTLFTLTHARPGLPHRTLAAMALARPNATRLMALTLGSTPLVVASDPTTAKEILTSPHFADRPLKQSARSLGFARAIGFAPNATYWRLLRRIASSHLFSPRRIAAHEAGRQLECAAMLLSIRNQQNLHGFVALRQHLQHAALNNIMSTVFGRRYAHHDPQLQELHHLVREGFQLLGAFNYSDYLPWLASFYDPSRINQRCAALLPRVSKFVRPIINDHRSRIRPKNSLSDDSDFVDVLLSLDGDEKLDENDMVAVLWVYTEIKYNKIKV